MPTYFYFKDYWTKPTLTNSISVNFGTNYDGKNYKQLFSLDPRDITTTRIDDVQNNVWKSRWYVRYNSPRGIVEYADSAPRKPLQIFSQWAVTRYIPGREIFWGNYQKIGDKVGSTFNVDIFRSTFPTLFSQGYQMVSFERQYPTFRTRTNVNYNDVIEVTYDQTLNNVTAGARYWFARNVGIIQLSWRFNKMDIPVSLNNPLVATYSNIAPIL